MKLKYSYQLSLVIFLLFPVSSFAIETPDSLCKGNPCIISSNIDIIESTKLDFGSRDLVLTARLVVRSSSLSIYAKSFRLEGSGRILGDGAKGVDINTTGDIYIKRSDVMEAVVLKGSDGGSLGLFSKSGSVYLASKVNLNSTTQDGIAGDLDASAVKNVDILAYVTSRGKDSGDVEIVSKEGSVVVDELMLSTGLADGQAGDVYIFAAKNVNVGQITATANQGSSDGGSVHIISETGIVYINGLINLSGNGSSGELIVEDSTTTKMAPVVTTTSTSTTVKTTTTTTLP
jgi:hypothetical protein